MTHETQHASSSKPTKRPRRMAREPRAVKSQAPTAVAPAQPSQPAVKSPSKSSQVLALLQRPEGATLDQLVEATGWLPHTTRAALTGLKKKGHVVTSEKRESEGRVYRALAA